MPTSLLARLLRTVLQISILGRLLILRLLTVPTRSEMELAASGARLTLLLLLLLDVAMRIRRATTLAFALMVYWACAFRMARQVTVVAIAFESLS